MTDSMSDEKKRVPAAEFVNACRWFLGSWDLDGNHTIDPDVTPPSEAALKEVLDIAKDMNVTGVISKHE